MEKVAVTVPEVEGRVGIACALLVLIDKGKVMLSLLDLVEVSDGTNDEILLEDVVIIEAYVEVEVSDVKL